MIILVGCLLVFNNSLIIQWLKCKGTSWSDITVSFPITFNETFSGTFFHGALMPGAYAWKDLNLSTVKYVFYRTDGSFSYTIGGIFIGC